MPASNFSSHHALILFILRGIFMIFLSLGLFISNLLFALSFVFNGFVYLLCRCAHWWEHSQTVIIAVVSAIIIIIMATQPKADPCFPSIYHCIKKIKIRSTIPFISMNDEHFILFIFWKCKLDYISILSSWVYSANAWIPNGFV